MFLFVRDIQPAAARLVWDCTKRRAIVYANYRLSALSALFSSRHLFTAGVNTLLFTQSFLVDTLVRRRLFGKNHYRKIAVGTILLLTLGNVHLF